MNGLPLKLHYVLSFNSVKRMSVGWAVTGGICCHILRSDERSPAQVALCFVIQQCEENVGRLGCHRRNLLHHLIVDLRKRFFFLETYDDVIHIRELASDRKYWSNIY